MPVDSRAVQCAHRHTFFRMLQFHLLYLLNSSHLIVIHLIMLLLMTLLGLWEIVCLFLIALLVHRKEERAARSCKWIILPWCLVGWALFLCAFSAVL